MYWWVALMGLSILGIVGLGIWFELYPVRRGTPVARWLKGSALANLALLVVSQVGLLLAGTREALAQAPVGAASGEVSIGFGLSLIGIGIPTALATIGAGIAVGPVGAASLAVIAEKPEVFGRTLVYLGLAEGIAIYGLVATILMLGRL
jgi:V/A-type H+-transporting ATPase subunit K